MILRAKYLITGDGRTCLQDQAVYLDKEGKIGWIGDAAEAAGRYPEEMVKDYGEATILPGLFDMHVHFGYYYSQPDLDNYDDYMVAYYALEQAKQSLRLGITTVRDLSCPPNLMKQLRLAGQKGYVTVPRIIHADAGICMTGGHGHQDGVEEADSPWGVRAAIRRQLRAGADWVKILTSNRGDIPEFTQEELDAAFQENTKAVYIETLGNPNSDVVDIEAIAKIAHAHKIPLVVDNTFATPYLVRPIEYGADIVVHSATKFIGGHGTTIGGVIVEGGKFDWEASGKFASLTEPNPSYHGVSFTKACGPAAFVTKIRAILLRDTGATISPVSSFIFLQGLETLSLRVERHVENALKVVQYLNNHPQVEKVHHPSVSTDPSQQELYKKYFPNGGGSIFTFEIKGDAQKAKDFIDNLELFSLLANVADVKSLVIHPATTTHSQCTEEELLDQGIKPNTIRLSIGTENVDDIIQDLDEAFKAVAE